MKMVLSLQRGALFHKIDVSEKLSKNDRFLIQKTSRNLSKIDQKTYQNSYQFLHRFLIDFDLQNGPQIRPRTSKNRSRDSPRASKTPPKSQKPPKDLPTTLPRAILDHFFIQKRASEQQFSSQESRFGGLADVRSNILQNRISQALKHIADMWQFSNNQWPAGIAKRTEYLLQFLQTWSLQPW